VRLSHIIGIIAGAVILLSVTTLILIKKPKKLKADRFMASWKELQCYCKDKSTWPNAVLQADKLFDAALKKRKLKGKTMGARMVSAQRLLSDNDAVWSAHNLAKKITKDATYNLKESDVKAALMGFRQALKDIGAFPAATVEQEKKQV